MARNWELTSKYSLELTHLAFLKTENKQNKPHRLQNLKTRDWNVFKQAK